MKLKIVVVEGNEKISLSLWGSKSGSTGGPATPGTEYVVEGDEVSMTGRDPVPAASDSGAGG